MSVKPWTPQDDRVLREQAIKGIRPAEIARYLKRTESAVRTRCSVIGAIIVASNREPATPIHEDFRSPIFDETPLQNGPRPISVPDHLDRGPKPCRIWRPGV